MQNNPEVLGHRKFCCDGDGVFDPRCLDLFESCSLGETIAKDLVTPDYTSTRYSANLDVTPMEMLITKCQKNRSDQSLMDDLITLVAYGSPIQMQFRFIDDTVDSLDLFSDLGFSDGNIMDLAQNFWVIRVTRPQCFRFLMGDHTFRVECVRYLI